jgi:lipopolysaccharide transport system permease protein
MSTHDFSAAAAAISEQRAFPGIEPHSAAGSAPDADRPRAGAPHLTIIAPAGRWAALDIRELWDCRELLFFLIWRDVKVRYKQTTLGVAWAIIQPLSTMVVFSLFFGRLGGMPSDGLPYPLFSFAALVPWTFFVYGLTQASNSVVASQHLITKVYFPRLAIPLATVLAGLVDFAVAFAILFGMMLWFGVTLTPRVIWIVPLSLLAVVTALGVGLWLSALNVKYRDVRYVVPFLTQLWLFGTPIAYPSSLLVDPWRTLYAVNPMAGVVEGFRWALLGSDTEPGRMLVVSSLVAFVALVTGAFYFRRVEATFADVV